MTFSHSSTHSQGESNTSLPAHPIASSGALLPLIHETALPRFDMALCIPHLLCGFILLPPISSTQSFWERGGSCAFLRSEWIPSSLCTEQGWKGIWNRHSCLWIWFSVALLGTLHVVKSKVFRSVKTHCSLKKKKKSLKRCGHIASFSHILSRVWTACYSDTELPLCRRLPVWTQQPPAAPGIQHSGRGF